LIWSYFTCPLLILDDRTWSPLNANLPTISRAQPDPSDASPLLSTTLRIRAVLPHALLRRPQRAATLPPRHTRHLADSTISQQTQPSFDRGSAQSHDGLLAASRGATQAPQYHQLYRTISGGAGSDVASSPALSALASLAASAPTAEVGSGARYVIDTMVEVTDTTHDRCRRVVPYYLHMLLGVPSLRSTIQAGPNGASLEAELATRLIALPVLILSQQHTLLDSQQRHERFAVRSGSDGRWSAKSAKRSGTYKTPNNSSSVFWTAWYRDADIDIDTPLSLSDIRGITSRQKQTNEHTADDEPHVARLSELRHLHHSAVAPRRVRVRTLQRLRPLPQTPRSTATHLPQDRRD